MRKILDLYKSEFSILILLIYSLGYCYLSFYYKIIGIPIEYYISLSDILFNAIEILVQILILFLAQEIVLKSIAKIIQNIYYSKTLNPKLRVRNLKKDLYERFKRLVINKEKEKHLNETILFLFMVLGSLIMIQFTIFKAFVMIYAFFLVVKLFFIIEQKNKKEADENKNLLIPLMLFCLFAVFTVWGLSDIKKVKTGKTNKVVEFRIDNQCYSTADENYNYIGESSTYLFLYDKKNEESLIFNKQNMSDLQYKIPFSKEENKLLFKSIKETIQNSFN